MSNAVYEDRATPITNTDMGLALAALGLRNTSMATGTITLPCDEGRDLYRYDAVEELWHYHHTILSS